MVLRHGCSHIRKSADIMLICSSPQLIAAYHVLLRLLMPRHSPYALFRLNSLACSHKFASCLSFANNCLGCNEKTVLSNILHHRFPPPGFPPTANCSSLFRKDLFLSSKLQLSVRFFPYSVFNEQSRSALRHPALDKQALVGLIESRFAKTLMRSVDQSRVRLRRRWWA